MSAKQTLLTGLQPSGDLHIGNYFGALRPFLDAYGEYDSFLMLADYHALTSLRDPKELRTNTHNLAKAYLAAGFDPEQATIFRQADAYKDKVAKGLEANAGLFTYPMLMAADILLYDTDIVPVGEDQRQHVEYAREAAAKFNTAYGETFKEPQEKILDTVAVVPGTDGKKMSKSYGNTIPLFGTKEEIQKAVMSIVTDSTGERPENVYNIHRLFKSEEALAALYTENKGKYKVLKDALVEDIEAVVGPMREKRASLTDSDVKAILKDGAERARAQAEKKMVDVRQKVGVTI